jgi:drug/metabolite transporter (DMT)-like permease
VVTALGYLAWNAALARVTAPRAAVFINVQPVAGAALVISGLTVTTTSRTTSASELN